MKPAPNPKDTQDFQFKQSIIRQVYDSLKSIPVACNLIVTDLKRGLLYCAYENKLTALKSEPEPINDWRLDHSLPYPISRLSVSCDYSYLAVTFNSSSAHIYNASSVSRNPLELLHAIELSPLSNNVYAYDLRWNPALPGIFCTVASDHSIGTFQVKVEAKATVSVIALENIPGLEAKCVAWSPKGKQLVIGCKNGNIIQLKPELKVARTIVGPSPPIGEIISILWISNYQFCAAYLDANERRINVFIIDAPKGDTKTLFTYYEDITYGIPDTDGEYFPRYYFDHIPEWNIIIAASSSSSEIAVLGSPDNGAHWEQWQLIDSCRAQLPLVCTSESYPVGITIDKSSTIILPWDAESTLPHPVPILHIYGTSGQIVSFHMVNLLPNCPSLCSPPWEPFAIPSRTSMLPSEISFTLSSAATSTPRSKQSEASVERPKVVVPTPSVLAESSKPVVTPVPVSLLAQPVAPQELKIPKPREPEPQPDVRASPVKELQASVPAPEVEKINYDDSIFWRNFCEEIGHFETELQSKLELPVWEIGTDEEKAKLIIQCAEMDEFRQELMETTNSLSNEIIYLKALLLQTFAWIEETKSRSSSNFISSRDRHDRGKIQELQKRFTHSQSQLIQAVKALDMRWVEHESHERTKMKIPSLEFVYQNLKKHAEIIAKERETLEHLLKKWKSLVRGNKMSKLNRSFAKLQLNSHPGSHVNGDGGIIEMRCRAIANTTKNFTKEKQIRLRDVLMRTEPRIIRAISPSPVQERLEATLSSLVLRNSFATPSKTIEQISERPADSVANKINPTTTLAASIKTVTTVATVANSITTTTTTIGINTGITTAPVTPTPVPKPTVSQQNPLASLNSIVAKLGSNESAVKTQPMNFRSQYPTFGNNTKVNDKPAAVNQQVKASVPPTTITQLLPITTAFNKPMLFGSQKQENIAPVFTDAQKTTVTFKPSDKPAQNIFSTASLGDALSKPTKGEHPSTVQIQQNLSTNLGTMSLSLNDASAVTSQSNVFSFANASSANNPPFNLTITKAPTTVTTTSSVQPLFLPVKSGDTATSAATDPTFVQTTTSSLDFSKISMDLSASLNNKVAATPSITIPSVSSSSVASTINFGKAISMLTPSQEVKNTISLPSGTTIEKVPTTTALPLKIFGGTNILGNSITTTASEFKSTGIASSVDKAATSAPSSFLNMSLASGFPQVPISTTSSILPINFEKSPTSSSAVFGKSTMPTALVSTASIAPVSTSSIFGQSAAASAAVTSPLKPPAAMASSYFSSNQPSTNTSSFNTMPNTSTFNTMPNSPPQNMFASAAASPEGATSIFSGTASTTGSMFGRSPKPSTMFGQAPTFGSSPIHPATGFGSPSTFGSKPLFGAQPSMFGAAKSEFGDSFGTGFGNMSFATTNQQLSNTPMDKVFGSTSGSSTFESLATQSSNLTFGSLAQKSPTAEKPAFSGGQSFTAWR